MRPAPSARERVTRPCGSIERVSSTVPIPEMVALWSWSEQFQLTKASGCGPSQGWSWAELGLFSEANGDRDGLPSFGINGDDGTGPLFIRRRTAKT